MKAFRILASAIIGTAVFSVVLLAGCVGDDNTIAEPDITVAYLSGEYAAQLLRDGAEVVFGNVAVTEDEDGAVWINISEMEYVDDQSQPNGYYIADKNLDSQYQLSPEARATFLSGGSSIAQVLGADDFTASAMQEAVEFEGKISLYYIYIIDDQVELLIARYIP
ncbi:MAG: hypothetical protein FWG53_01495 [Clostridiales bacterium]|nr:hypothetical protein [Clostridiales bacterium]